MRLQEGLVDERSLGFAGRSTVDSINLPQLWTVAAMLGGFQVAALSWRINREVVMESMEERTWVTWADFFVALSFFVLVGGVFLSPLWGVSTSIAVKLFGPTLTLFAPSVFILAGHYNLYGEWEVRYDSDNARLHATMAPARKGRGWRCRSSCHCLCNLVGISSR